jgi:hypothetical protein
MPIALTDEEMGHLKWLASAGELGRTVTAPPPHHGLSRLVEAGYVIDQETNPNAVLYVITDLGRHALATAERDR